MMIWAKRLRFYWATGLFLTVVYHEWHQPGRLLLMLIWAAVFAVVASLAAAVTDRAWERRWPKRQKQREGAA